MHFKQNNKESKSYVQGLRRFENTLPRGIKGILKKNGYNYSEIINKWNFLVGKSIANCSYPKSIKMRKGNAGSILTIAVKRGDEITLEYAKKEIINRINSYFGYALLNEVKLVSINSEKKKEKNSNKKNIFSKNFEKKIEQIKSEEIKKSLSQLLNAIRNV